MQPKNYGDIFLPELPKIKRSTPSSPQISHLPVCPPHPRPQRAGAQGVGGEESSSPPPPLGHPDSRIGCQVKCELCLALLAHLRALHRPPPEASLAGPTPVRLLSPDAASAAGGCRGWPPPHSPTYWAGARVPRVREKGILRTHFWEWWPLLLGARERILQYGCRRGRGGNSTPSRSRARREERGGARPRWLACGAGEHGRRRGSSGLSPRATAPRQLCSCARGQGISSQRLLGPTGGGELRKARHGADARL